MHNPKHLRPTHMTFYWLCQRYQSRLKLARWIKNGFVYWKEEFSHAIVNIGVIGASTLLYHVGFRSVNLHFLSRGVMQAPPAGSDVITSKSRPLAWKDLIDVSGARILALGLSFSNKHWEWEVSKEWRSQLLVLSWISFTLAVEVELISPFTISIQPMPENILWKDQYYRAYTCIVPNPGRWNLLHNIKCHCIILLCTFIYISVIIALWNAALIFYHSLTHFMHLYLLNIIY